MKTETQELQIVTQPELQAVLTNTKIELSKAEQHAVAFAPSMQEYLTLSKEISSLDKINPSEADAKKARETRLKMVKVRTGAEEIKDIRKEGVKAEGDLIQALFNVVKNSCLVTEAEFTEIEKHQERQEAKRKAELSESRTALLEPFGTDTTYLPLDIMTDDQFNRLLENEQLASTARKEAAEKLELARIEAERVAEENRLAEIKRQEEEREAQRLENERLRKENELKEAQLAQERESAAKETKRLADIAESERKAQQAIIDAQNAEAEKARKDNEKRIAEQKAANDKLASELKAKQDAEQKAIADAKAKEEAAAKEREAAEKAALLAPDKEKVRALFESIKAIDIPKFTTTEGKAIGKLVSEELAKLTKSVIIESKKLV